jgi:hypothetical protein
MVAELGRANFSISKWQHTKLLSSLVRGSHLSITMAIGDQGGRPGSI